MKTKTIQLNFVAVMAVGLLTSLNSFAQYGPTGNTPGATSTFAQDGNYGSSGSRYDDAAEMESARNNDRALLARLRNNVSQALDEASRSNDPEVHRRADATVKQAFASWENTGFEPKGAERNQQVIADLVRTLESEYGSPRVQKGPGHGIDYYLEKHHNASRLLRAVALPGLVLGASGMMISNKTEAAQMPRQSPIEKVSGDDSPVLAAKVRSSGSFSAFGSKGAK